MAKSKNACRKTLDNKNHKNGIKKAPKLCVGIKQRGFWTPGIKNTRKVRKNNQKAAIAARKDRLKKIQASFGKK